MMQFEFDEQQLNVNNNTFTKVKSIGKRWDNTILLGEWMSVDEKGKYICKMKLNHIDGPEKFMVGIVGNEYNTNINMHKQNKNGYTIDACGRNWIRGKKQPNIKFEEEEMGITDDLYILTLDLNLLELDFVIKNKNEQEKIKHKFVIDASNVTKYKFAMSLMTENDSITVMNVSNINSYEINEQKEMQNEMQNEIESLKQMLTEKDTKIAVFTHALKLQKEENEKLKAKVSSLEDEQKMFIMENSELKKEIKEFKKKEKIQNMNPDKYFEWSAEEIVWWIVSLNPNIYGKYENILLKQLTEQNVNGNCLLEVNENDLMLWGITDFMLRKNLLKSIKQLVSRQHNDVGPLMNENVNFNQPQNKSMDTEGSEITAFMH